MVWILLKDDAGYTATKKIGNAVVRNLSKRRLRAVARENLIQLGLPNVDYVFIAKKQLTLATMKS